MDSEAIIPNSNRMELLVKMNVAKPAAVVVFVKKVAFPIFCIPRASALALLPWLRSSLWYLLIRNTQLGTPITIIKGGTNAVSIVSG